MPAGLYYVVISPLEADWGDGRRRRNGARISMAHSDPQCSHLRGRSDVHIISGPKVALLGFCSKCCSEEDFRASITSHGSLELLGFMQEERKPKR